MNNRNLPNTKAYLRLREQVQGSFDFAVVVCYAVPALKRQLSLLDKGVITALPKPDYYPPDKNPPKQLRQQAMSYRGALATHLLISTFSFFEAFVEAAIREVIDYHGGAEAFQRRAKERDAKFIAQTPVDIAKHQQRLRGPVKKAKAQRYSKHSNALVKGGYRFPTELFSAYGVRMLLQKLGNIKAVDLPDMLRDGFHLDINDSDVAAFHNMRDARNRIAHGDVISLSLKQVAEYNALLRQLAYRFDQHLNLHFLITEDFIAKT